MNRPTISTISSMAVQSVNNSRTTAPTGPASDGWARQSGHFLEVDTAAMREALPPRKLDCSAHACWMGAAKRPVQVRVMPRLPPLLSGPITSSPLVLPQERKAVVTCVGEGDTQKRM